MARTRRKMAKPPRKRRRADWVYRSAVFDSAAGAIDDLYTYAPFTKVLGAGTANANAAILYDSHNYTAATVQGLFDAPRVRVWAPARAEGLRAFIHRVEGLIILRPSVWAAGSILSYGCRFGIYEQDPAVGAFLIDPAYSMWGLGANVQNAPAHWANDRKWQHERRFISSFTSTQTAQPFMLRFSFSVRRSLNPNECYGIYSEAAAESVTSTEQMWFRTLVSDEG